MFGVSLSTGSLWPRIRLVGERCDHHGGRYLQFPPLLFGKQREKEVGT